MPSEKFTFTGHAGDALAARLDLPVGEVRAAAIFAHCFTCGKDIAAARRIAARLSRRGIAVLRFDVTGLGHSEGEFPNAHVSANVADIRAAAAHLETRGLAPGLLVGHSLGGVAVLLAAHDLPTVKAVATIGAPSDPGHLVERLGVAERIAAEGAAEVTIGGRAFTLTREFVEDAGKARLLEAVHAMRKALLVLHSPVDEVVGIAAAAELFGAARQPRSFVTLDGADHLLSDREDAEYAAEIIAGWSARYLHLGSETLDPATPEGVVRVSEADAEGYLQDVNAGPRHHVRVDEPIAAGGDDLGFTPYQLVSAGLGACTSMTIRMYAGRKGWPLTHVSVDVEHEKVHAEDCHACETKEGRIDRFRRIVRLEGPLDAAQRARLMEIADRCPVHRTLEGEVAIETVAAG